MSSIYCLFSVMTALVAQWSASGPEYSGVVWSGIFGDGLQRNTWGWSREDYSGMVEQNTRDWYTGIQGDGVTNCILFHARVGRFSPFCIRGLWPLLYLWSVDMTLISFWLLLVSSYSSCPRIPCVPRVLVFLVFLVSFCSTCSSVPHVLERSSSQFGDRQPRVKKHPKTALKIATHDS